MIIRREEERDYREVEEITRKAFWNEYRPGCDEHYLVHIMRSHKDFIPELDFVLEEEGRIIANVMYTKAKLVSESGLEKEILTFGPVCVLPEFQRKGYGGKLLEHSFQKAIELGHDMIVIFGNPENYICRGFKSCRKYNISTGNAIYPVPLLVKELSPVKLPDEEFVYRESPVYEVDQKKAEEFDLEFEPLEKGYKRSQELFYIYSHSRTFD